MDSENYRVKFYARLLFSRLPKAEFSQSCYHWKESKLMSKYTGKKMRRLILTNKYIDWNLIWRYKVSFNLKNVHRIFLWTFTFPLNIQVYIQAPSSQANLSTFHLLVPLCKKERKSHHIQCEEVAYMLNNCTTLKCNLIIFILLL